MGVVNVTPDSFSDGGRYAAAETAIAHGRRLAAEGADIIDVGGEATGPRSTPVDEAEELRRVLPVVEALAGAGLRVSIDTTKAAVAEAALARGATIVNDVSGGLFDPRMREVLEAAPRATYICGHLRGASIAEVFAREGRDSLTFDDVVLELAARLELLPDAVVARTWLDPGIGFGKSPQLNALLVTGAGRLGFALDRPVVIGPSRKRFLRQFVAVEDPTEADLDEATVAACGEALAAGPMVVRVHNVALLHAALTAYNNE